MKAKSRVIGLLGVLAIGLAACADGPLQRSNERNAELALLHRQIDSLQSQYQAKDEEAKRLATELAAAKKSEAQVTGLVERLRGMQDIVMAKDVEISRLEAQLNAAKKKAPVKGTAKKAKPSSSMKSKEIP